MIEAEIVRVADTAVRDTWSSSTPEHPCRARTSPDAPGDHSPEPAWGKVCGRELVDIADAAAVAMPDACTGEQKYGSRRADEQRVARFRASAGVEQCLPCRGRRRLCRFASRCCSTRIRAPKHPAA